MTQTTIISNTGQLATPTNAAFATASTGGTLVPATYWYRVSALVGTTETLASTQTSQVVGAGTSTNTVTVNWTALSGATGYNVYGRTTGAELLIATVGAVTTYIDTGAITPAGALPGANTTPAGAYALTSATQTIAAGAKQLVGIFTSDAKGIPPNTTFDICAVTPGNPRLIGQLRGSNKPCLLEGPLQYTVSRPDISADGIGVGAWVES